MSSLRTISVWKATGLLFCSGLCALLYQVVWLREMRLFFGSSMAASGIVLGVFMGGLGIGAVVIGKKIHQSTRPLLIYGYLELGIAICALLSPFLIIIIRKIYIGLGGVAALGPSSAIAIRVALSLLVLLIPTFLMGGTLPAMALAVETPEDKGRRDIGLLYGLNTLGGVVGVILATFLLLELLGNRLTVWTGGLFNLLVAGMAFYMARNLPTIATQFSYQRNETDYQKSQDKTNNLHLILYLAAFVSGFGFLLMELVWYRMLAPLLGGSTYTFGLILAVALAGIGFGGWLYGLRSHHKRPSTSIFALLCSLEAFFMVLPFALGDRIAILTALLNGLSVVGFKGQVIGWIIVASSVVLMPAVIAGIQLPMLIGLLGEGDRNIGKHTGYIYGFNTAGAILGSLFGGFGLIPLLSAPGCWQLVVVLLVVLTLFFLILSIVTEGKKTILILPVLLTTISLYMVTTDGPTSTWRHRSIGSGHQENISDLNQNQLSDWLNTYRRQIIWEQDGQESTIGLHAYDSLSFIVNGKSDGNAVIDAPTQVMGPLIGAILHPNPQKGLVIGLGTGSSGGWLAEIPSMKKVDIVEIEPAILEVARRCAPVNFNVLEHPKVDIIINDGREFVLTAEEIYDVIFSEPSDPYRAGIASLYTKEFYQAVSQRLSKNGIFSQWIQTYYVDAKTIRTIAATLGSVFSNVEIWLTDDSNLLFISSNTPIRYSVPRLRKRLSQEPFVSALTHAWGVSKLEGLLAAYIANDELIRTISNNEINQDIINTDDRMLVEFALAKTTGQLGLFSVNSFIQEVQKKGLHRPETSGGEIDWFAVKDNYFWMMLWFGKNIEPGLGFDDNELQIASFYKKFLGGNFEQILEAWQAGIWPNINLPSQVILAESLADEADIRSLELAKNVSTYWPGTSNAITARYYWRNGESQKAYEALANALIDFKNNPWQFRAVIVHSFQLAMEMAYSKFHADDLYKHLLEPLSVYNFEEYRKFALLQISKTLDPQLAVQALSQWEPHVPWNETILNDRVKLYEKAGSPLLLQAQRDLQEFHQNKPVSFFELAN